MKLPFLLCRRACLLWVAGLVMVSAPADARDRLRIPPPPSPEKVVSDIRSFIHRVAGRVKHAGKKTWNAVREPFVEEDNGPSTPPRRPRTPSRPASPVAPRLQQPRPAPAEAPEFFETRTAGRVAGAAEQPLSAPVRPGPDDAVVPFQPTEPTAGPRPDRKTPPDAPKAALPAAEETFEFARPVPGKRGLVYPPGLAQKPENMVDVEGLTPGQLVRDPRSGKLFRVP